MPQSDTESVQEVSIMPRPDSGFLSGVLAGINQFKQTKQFYEQMESTNLQQEASRAQLDAFKQQQADYESPTTLRARELEDYEKRLRVGTILEQELYGKYRTRAGELPSTPEGVFRLPTETGGWQYIADPKAKLKDINSLSAEKALAAIDGYAKQQGIEMSGGASEVSLGALNKAVAYAQAGMWGEALTVVRADQLAKLPELDWMDDLPDDAKAYAKNWLLTVATDVPTTDIVVHEMNKLRMQFEQNGVLQPRTNIDALIRGKYPVNAPMSPQRYLMPKQGPSGA